MSGAERLPPVRWTEVRVLAPVEWCELVGEVLAAACPNGVAFGRPSLAAEPPPDGLDYVRAFAADSVDDAAWRARVRAEVAALAEATGAPELAGLDVSFRELPPEDYATSWRKVWRPFRVGRLCLIPGWTPEWVARLRPGDVPLVFEPGGAFGSGRHPTTRMCLRALQERLAAGDAPRVLDAGSGSGILAVGARRLGAREALGFDVDPHARPYAEDLARRNDVSSCAFRTGGFECLSDADGTFDVVLANLYSDLLQRHAGELAARLAPGGWFVFSGCPDRHAEPTLRALAAAGLRVAETRRRGRWLAFLGRRVERAASPRSG